MKILVIGSGGREHALVWKLAQSPRVKKIFCAPGNAGIAQEAECVPINADDIQGLLAFALTEEIDLTIVGPELPLSLGIVDTFQDEHLNIFGPSVKAACLESSKVFAKEFCLKHKIPTPKAVFFDDIKQAVAYVETQNKPMVIKADGLAAGKGVLICQDKNEGLDALKNIMVARSFGDAGNKVVIEEFIEGEELSFIAISDGETILPLASSQDHKRALDNDLGLNTGGMGAYSPASILTQDLHDQIMHDIMQPVIKGMAAQGTPFIGILYAGIMIKNNVPYVLEFNCRFGDPETQPILMRLNTDLLDIIESAVSGYLASWKLDWKPDSAVCVVMAAEGYPGRYEKGRKINGLNEVENLPGVKVFHAGTLQENNQIVTNGGRVLGVTALGEDINIAVRNAYAAVEKISWEGVHYRKDIGKRALGGKNG
ncbi:MAG: phosphoribosylamine--glycine ligase [Pseudomonadota bacterium]